MQPVYAVQFNMANDEQLDSAWAHVQQHRDGVLDGGGRAADSTVYQAGDERLERLAYEVEDRHVQGRIWVNQAWRYRTSGTRWLRIRVGTRIDDSAAMIDDHPRVFAPSVVRRIIEDVDLTIDGGPIRTEPFTASTIDDASTLVGLLLMDRRQLPVVGVSTDESGAALIDINLLARQAAGLAHVVRIDPSASWSVTKLLSKQLGVYRQAVRLWWPGLTAESDPYDHPLWLPPRLDSAAALWRIFERIRLAAVARYGIPNAEARLRAAQRRRDLEEQRALATAERQIEASTQAEEYEELLQIASEELEGIQERKLELELLNEDLMSQLATAKANLQAMGMRDRGTSTPEEGRQLAEQEPQTVLEAVKIAAPESQAVEFHPQAYESAAESEFGDPAAVLGELRTIIQVAEEWAQGRGSGDFRQRFGRVTSNYRTGISETARQRYTADYTIEVDGETRMMGPHLRKGTGPKRDSQNLLVGGQRKKAIRDRPRRSQAPR